MQLLSTLLLAVKTKNFPDLTVALGQICERAKWDYGEVWMRGKDSTILQMCPASYINTHTSKDGISRGAIQAL